MAARFLLVEFAAGIRCQLRLEGFCSWRFMEGRREAVVECADEHLAAKAKLRLEGYTLMATQAQHVTTCHGTRGTAFYATAAAQPKMQATGPGSETVEPTGEPEMNVAPFVDPLAGEDSEVAAAAAPSSGTTMAEVIDKDIMTAGRQAERRIKKKHAEDGDHADRNRMRKARRLVSKAQASLSQSPMASLLQQGNNSDGLADCQ